MYIDKFRMDGRVALITGAGRGIGSAMAEALASVGCAVAIQDIEQDVARETARRITDSTGSKTAFFGGDIGDIAQTATLVERTRDQLGGFHVLINNAAIQSMIPWLEVPVEHMEKEFRADLIAPVVLTQKAVPIMQAQKWGRILNVGSIQQRGGNVGMLAYAMSKAALEKFTMSCAKVLAPDQITVNNVAPGWFNTLRNKFSLPDEKAVEEKGKAHVPLGRIGEPEDCAGVTLLLCSDAGSYITGQTIYVAGGW